MTVAIVAAPLLVGSTAPPLSALGPQLTLAAPQHVEVGQAIEIEVSLQNAPAVAGYEASVRFDKTAAEFGGVVFGSGKASGDVVTTITDAPAGGIAYAAYTCRAAGCPADDASASQAALQRQQVRIEPLQAGRYTVSFDQLKFVDLQGHAVGVDVPAKSVTIDVGAATSVYSSSPAAFALPGDSSGTPAASALDVDHVGGVTSADVYDLAASWTDARRYATCTPPDAGDPNGDGCLDVADLQLVGGANNASAAAPTGPTAAGSVGPRLEVAGVPWVVNTTNDLPDSNIGNGKCETAAGNHECSLRAAIHESNATAGPDTITFNIPGGGVKTIQLGTALPTLTDSAGVTIDGYTQPGSQKNTDPVISNAVIMVNVRGNGVATTDFGAFRITSSNNRIQGLAVWNVFDHFELTAPGATNNVIAGNFIGSDAGSSFLAPSSTEGGSGVAIRNGANHNLVGTPALADRNVIGGTPSTGIRIEHVGSRINTVQNNLFGLKPHGDGGLPLGWSGVDTQFGASDNLIGGAGQYEHNVISGAKYTAIDLSHQVNTTANRVYNNFIGTTAAGNATTPYTKNVYGVAIKDAVEDNFISGNVIGGSTGQGAIWVKFDYNGRNYIFDNHIGVALDGTALPNAQYGMFIQGHDMQVGPGNVIANNTAGGVVVTDANGSAPNTSIRNRITGNTFGSNNGKLAIDLTPGLSPNLTTGTVAAASNGPTPNDAGDGDSGPNTFLNYPVLSPASTTSATGSVCANCRVEVYKAVADTFGRGVGQKLIGVATAAADGTFNAVIGNVAVGDKIAGITIDTAGNTSEFSPLATVTTVGAPPPQPPTTSASSFKSLQPARLLETRPNLPTVDGQFQGGGPVGRGGTVELVVAGRGGVPADASAVSLNVTVTEAVGPGFVTAYPCGSQRPVASNLNYVAGQTVPNLVISQVGAGGTVCLFVSEGTHLVADVTGYFPPGSEFESLVPARLLETRADLPTADGQFQGTGALGRDSTLALPVAGRGGVPANATAVVLNITATGPSGPGFVTAYPCGGARPVASNLNFVAGQTVPNLAIVRLSSDGTVCLYAMESTHLIADVEGYFTPDSSFGSLVPARLLETRAGLPTVDGQFQGGGPVGRGSTLTLTVNGRGGVP
ncbi:MAG: hypothetical protein QOE00_902, partial [Ilumatobacteraceae bacterium]